MAILAIRALLVLVRKAHPVIPVIQEYQAILAIRALLVLEPKEILVTPVTLE